MRIVVLACFLAFLSLASAATITTRGTGDWSATLTWTGGVLPTASDDVVVAHSITVNVADAVAVFANITSTGRITVAEGRSLTLNSAAVAGGIQGNGAVTITSTLSLSTTVSSANVRLLGTASTLTLGGDVANSANRLLEAIQIVLSGSAARNIDGSVQTNKYGAVSVSSSTLTITTSSALRLGGVVNLGNSAVTVAGDLVLIGSGLTGTGAGASLQSSGDLTFTPAVSNFAVGGSSVTVAAGNGKNVAVTTNAVSVNAGCTFTVNSDIVVAGSLEASNGTAIINSLTLSSTGAVSMVGGGSVLTVRGGIFNPNNRAFDADLLVLPGTESGARAVSGAIQTRYGRTQVAVDQTLTASDSSVVIGGVLDLAGNTLNLAGGNFTLAGQGLVNGGKIIVSDWLLVSASSSSYILQSAQVELQSSETGFVYILPNKRFDLSSRRATINRLLAAGQLYSTAGGQAVIGSLWIAAAGSVTLSGTGSSVTVTGDISNLATSSSGFQAETVVLGGAPNSIKTVTGQVQTLKTAALVVSCDQTLQQAAGGAAIRLGGVLQLNGFELMVTSPSGEDVVLSGNGITSNGGAVVSQSGDLLVDGASTAYVVTGEASLIAATGARVHVVANRRLTVDDSSKLTITPQLFLEGATLDGNGRAVVQDLVLGTSATGVKGQVKLGTTTGVLDVTGDIDNSIDSTTFYAQSIRLLGAFSRTIRGPIQTSSGAQVVIGCSTTLTADSTATIGGRLYLNGQTLNINSDLVINAAQLFGPGLIRFDDGCGCSPPAVNIAQASSFTVSSTPVFQNVIVNVNRSTTLSGASTIFTVGGARSKLIINNRISGQGNIKAYYAEVNGPSGRISLTATSYIETDLPVVNRVTSAIVGVQRTPTPEPESECVDDLCMRFSVRDLRRQVTALSSALRNSASFGSCESGTCPGWNADYTSLSCPASSS